jgi:anti-sigma factor RsiW
MRHERALVVLPKLIDEELGPVRRWLVSRHISQCATCMGILEDMQAVRSALRTSVMPHRAPHGLAERIGMALAREVQTPAPVRKRLNFAYPGMSLAGAAAGVALTVLVMNQGPSSDRLAMDLVSSHVRSMMADHLMDVPTSDRHTVKPWLSAHMDFSPEVKDLVAQGFPLVGGRMDYVEGRDTAAIVYKRDKHVINLFVFKRQGVADTDPKQSRVDGFNIITWRESGLQYAAVSDVEAAQLQMFVQLVRGG